MSRAQSILSHLHSDQKGLSSLALHVKLFLSLFMGILALTYLAFLGQIWLDTNLSMRLIIEAYKDMSLGELMTHSYRYLGWFCACFGVVLGCFLFTCYHVRVKSFFSVWAPFWVLSDILSTWLIRYSDIFAWQLYVSGFLLAASFLILFLMIQYDIWLCRKKIHT